MALNNLLYYLALSISDLGFTIVSRASSKKAKLIRTQINLMDCPIEIFIYVLVIKTISIPGTVLFFKFYLLRNDLKFSLISLNPLAVVCNSCSKPLLELQIALLNLPRNRCKKRYQKLPYSCKTAV
jgi:hypothetical protein